MGAPVAAGFSTVLLTAKRRRVSLMAALGLGNLTVLVVGVLLLLFAFEGVICLIMAAPIAAFLASLGALLAWLLVRVVSVSGFEGFHAMGAVALLMTLEPRLAVEPPVFATTTTIDIAAPRKLVWHHVIAFSDITAPPSLLFRTGLAYPIRAQIVGSGVGAVRYCEFSTGSFVEPIMVWDEPRELRFTVTATPPPMEEWSPWRGIKPAHVEGYFLSRGGQFLLEELQGERTRVHATTWHTHQIWPAHYWKMWTELLIHQIHYRVLEHIEALSTDSRLAS